MRRQLAQADDADLTFAAWAFPRNTIEIAISDLIRILQDSLSADHASPWLWLDSIRLAAA